MNIPIKQLSLLLSLIFITLTAQSGYINEHNQHSFGINSQRSKSIKNRVFNGSKAVFCGIAAAITGFHSYQHLVNSINPRAAENRVNNTTSLSNVGNLISHSVPALGLAYLTFKLSCKSFKYASKATNINN